MSRENFPVGSLLLPANLRPHVHAFYAFARTADDVADDPKVDGQERHAALAMFRQAVLGQGEGPSAALTLHRHFEQTGTAVENATALLDAFDQDVDKNRYDSWTDLMAYCQMSAAPVGRYLIDLHGGAAPGGIAASDALCAALQVINHLQDCKHDFETLDRVYLPLPWFEDAGATVEDLKAGSMSSGLRKVIDRALDGVDGLLNAAQPLASLIHSRRLAREAAGIHALASKLADALRQRDPLAEKVRLSKARSALVFLQGALFGAGASVKRSSFYWGMRVLSERRRQAMFDVYGFCRAVDDVADGAGNEQEKRRDLAQWRADVDALFEGRPGRLSHLEDPVRRYSLQRADFDGLIDGMELDAAPTVRMATMDGLAHYCDQVACTVGRMSSRIFGAPVPMTDTVAHHLGLALQYTNILRDVADDADHDRLYLPRDLLDENGVDGDGLTEILAHPNLPVVCDALAVRAQSHYRAADEAMRLCGPSMRPARIMRAVYGRLLHHMMNRRWQFNGQRPSLSTVEKIYLVLRHGLF